MATKFRLREGVESLTKSGKEYKAEDGVITVTHQGHIGAFQAEGYEVVPEDQQAAQAERKGAAK